MKNIIIISIALCCSIQLRGQQDFLLTNFNSNSLFINPAYAGSNGDQQGSLFFNYRDQWLGLEGSPRTMMIGGEYNLARDRVGIGGSIARESIGIDNRIDLLSNFAYRLQFDKPNQYLSFGVRVGYHSFTSDFEAINYTDGQDLIYDSQDNQFGVLSIGTGVYYTHRYSYIGFSIPSITAITTNKAPFKSRHLYLHAGTKIYFDDASDLAIEPTILLKYEAAAPLQYSIGSKLWFIEQFGIGALYRSEDGIALSLHTTLASDLDLGVSYDFSTSELNQNNVGSVEIFVGYRIDSDNNDPFR